MLARTQDARVRRHVLFLNATRVVLARREQRLEELSFGRRPVFSVWCRRRGGAAAPPLAGARRGGGSEGPRGQLGPGCGLCRLGQGLRFPPHVGFDQRQAVLQLHQDLVLGRESVIRVR